jgi:hypothetical protein
MRDLREHTTKTFGQTLTLFFVRKRPLTSFSAGWSAVAGAIAVGVDSLTYSDFFHFVLLWLLADALIGTVWEIAIEQRLWERLRDADLPAPPAHGIMIPYAQPHSLAGQGIIAIRRYTKWLHEYNPVIHHKLTTVLLATLLALLLAFYLQPPVFWLALLALGLTWIFSFTRHALSTAGGGRLQSITQFLLPWLMGMLIWPKVSIPALLLALCLWAVYLGGLRMLGNHKRANWLFFMGQIAAVLLLLSLQQLVGAVIIFFLLVIQISIYQAINEAGLFFIRTRYHLFTQLIIAALSLGVA